MADVGLKGYQCNNIVNEKLVAEKGRGDVWALHHATDVSLFL